MSKRSTSKLHGPEEVLDDAVSVKTDVSSTRTILRSLAKRDSPRSKHSSFHSSPPKEEDSKPSTAHSSPIRASSPIPIPNSSPPPIIDLQIESGDMSPKRLFGLDSPPPTGSREPFVMPAFDTASRDQLIINSRRSKRQAVKSEIICPPVPRRTSNDHWRLRQAARNRSAKLPEIPQRASPVEGLIPGIGLPLEELSIDSTAPPRLTDTGPLTQDLDGTSERVSAYSADVQLEGHLQSPSAGHIDSLSGRWISNDPVARAASPLDTDDGMSGSFQSTGLAALRQAAKDVATRQVLLEKAPDVLSHESLRAELEAGRKALESLERRLAGVEAGLRRSSAGSTPSKSRELANLSIQTRLPSTGQSKMYTSPKFHTSPTQSRVTSSSFSFSSMKSPLEVQDLFYDSDNECWNIPPVRKSISADFDSATSEAQAHLHDMQPIAMNGSIPIPTMGPPEDFFRMRTERAARYYNLFHVASPSREPSSSVSAARTDELAESAFRARTPEMLSWLGEDDHSDENVLATADSVQEEARVGQSPKAATSVLDEGEDLAPTRQLMLRNDLVHSLGWHSSPGLRGSPASPTGLYLLSPGRGSWRPKGSSESDGSRSDDGIEEDSRVVHRERIAWPSP